MWIKNYLHKILSVFLFIILSFSLFNFSAMASESTNLVSLQRAADIEMREPLAKLSKEKFIQLKNNILVHYIVPFLTFLSLTTEYSPLKLLFSIIAVDRKSVV